MPKHLIITTVGTSIFTNFNKKEVRQAFDNAQKGREYNDGVRLDDLEDDGAQSYDEDIYESIETKIENYWLKRSYKEDGKWKYDKDKTSPNTHASAEITSILKIAERLREEDQDAQIEVKLLATDTALSVSAAKLIETFFRGLEEVSIREFSVGQDFVQSLGVNPKSSDTAKDYYDAGLQNLVDGLMGEGGLIKKAKKGGFNPVINFSGGYKSTIPVLTIIAQLEDIPMYYIYEDSDYLMEVGNLPFNFDWASVERLHYYLSPDVLNHRDLNDDIKIELKNKKLIEETSKGFKISPLGKLFQKVRDLMPDGGGTFGKFVEIKLWEHFVKKPFDKYDKGLPLRGKICYKNIHTYTIVDEIPQNEEGQNNYERIEIDLIMYSENEDYVILESKSLNGIKSVKPELYLEGAKFWHNGVLPNLFIVTFYKYEHEGIQSRKQQLEKLQEQVFSLGIREFRAYYFNLPLSKDETRVNYQDFIDSPELELVDALKELNI
jgi:putative CRISPR-associated protein (TIGR02619 family)